MQKMEGTSRLLFDPLQLFLQVPAQIDIVEVATAGKLHGKSGCDIHLGRGIGYLDLQDVAARLAVLGDEMQMVSRHIHSLDKVGRPDSHHASGDVGEVEDRLIL